jgi:hypothetical protein
MLRPFFFLLAWLAVFLVGCSKTEQPPPPEGIPDIPPGRTAAGPTSGAAPAPPTHRRQGR